MSASAMSPGGRAWLVWGLGAAFYAYGFFQRVAPAVMVDDLMRDFALGAALLGSLSAAYFYAYAAVQIPVGILLDRFGPRPLLLGATLLAAAGSVLFALAVGFGTAALGRALIGVGVGVAYIGTLQLAVWWFPPRRFPLVAGLTLAAGLLGGIAAQAPLAALVEAFGWRATMWGAGLAALGLALAMARWVQSRPPDRPDPRLAPTQPAAAHATPDEPAPVAPPARLLDDLRALLGGARIWLLAAFAGGMGAPILALAGLWAVPYLTHAHGLSRAGAGAAVSAMLAAWAFGGPAAGWLSERTGRGRAMIGAALTAVASLLLLSLWPRAPLGAVVGLFVSTGLAGGFMIVAFAITRDRYAGRAAATAMGVVNTAVLLVGAALQSLIGFLLDRQWTGLEQAGARIYTESAYRHAFLVLAATSALALLSALALSLRRSERGR
jgi:MFS family permease